MDSIAGTFFNREVKILHCAPNTQAEGDKRLILQTANSDCKLLEIHSAGDIWALPSPFLMDHVQAILAVLTLPDRAGAPSYHQAVISADFTLGMVIKIHTWIHAHSYGFQLSLQERVLVPKEKENFKRWSFVPKAKKYVTLITLINCWHLCEGLEFGWSGKKGSRISPLNAG